MASPKFGLWWVLWVCGCPWLNRAPKCSNYALNNLLFSLCRSMWVIELLVNLPSPILKFQHALLPPKCYKPRNVPQLLLLPLFSPLDSVESIRELGGASQTKFGYPFWLATKVSILSMRSLRSLWLIFCSSTLVLQPTILKEMIKQNLPIRLLGYCWPN